MRSRLRSARLVPPAEPGVADSQDPAVLAREAALASARALRENRLSDAATLTTLSDRYARMARVASSPGASDGSDEPIDVAAEDRLRGDLLERLKARAESLWEAWAEAPELTTGRCRFPSRR